VNDNVAERSAIFALADQYVRERARLDPLFGTKIGEHDVDHLLPDFSAEQRERNSAHTKAALDALGRLQPDDELDRVAKAVMTERLESRYELESSGEERRTWGVLYSPLSKVRQAFELMPATNAEEAQTVRARLTNVRDSLQSWRDDLDDAGQSGLIPSRRHVLGVAEQAVTYATGAFRHLAERVAHSALVDVDDSGLAAAAADADDACAELAQYLKDNVAPHATDDGPCGLERYSRWFRSWNGSALDADDLYEWGWRDLRRITERMWVLAADLVPGATSLRAVAEALEADEDRAIYGTPELLQRLVSFTETTIKSLDGVHFDIDPRIRRCDVRLAPEGSAAAPYYISPSEDLSRPGTTWYPTLGADRFGWWRLATIWYHEAVPGHHLQIATALIQYDRLSRFHRLDGMTSGYGEGWALYAERLMDELGGFADPGVEMGHLAAQALRAARVVVDLGLHLGLEAPEDLGELGTLGDCSGRVWNAEMAVALLEEMAIQSPEFATSEVDRYLSLPGQATSYKVGERVWLETREAARARLGDGFDLKRFHAHSLALGPMGLDPFRAEMATWDGR
jgi:uncharacterized protein (DUF885 family)